jgi:hypothetical protein
MQNPVEMCAWVSIARGCGFAGLATVCAMVGIAFDPALSLKLGGYCALLTSSILLLKAWRAWQVRYSHTETWMMLNEHERPPKPIAQAVISGARQRMLYLFASHSAKVALAMLIGSLAVRSVLGR